MRFPVPEDMAAAPVWRNYVVAQAAHAALGLIPPDVHALGVRIDALRVVLVVQRSAIVVQDQDVDDVWDIAGDLAEFLGPEAAVEVEIQVRDEQLLSPDDGIGWFFSRRRPEVAPGADGRGRSADEQL